MQTFQDVACSVVRGLRTDLQHGRIKSINIDEIEDRLYRRAEAGVVELRSHTHYLRLLNLTCAELVGDESAVFHHAHDGLFRRAG